MALSFVTDLITPVTKRFISQVVNSWNIHQTNRLVNLTFMDHEELRDALEGYLTCKNPPDVLTWFAGNRMKSFIDRELMIKTETIRGVEKFYQALQPRFQTMFDKGDAQYFIPTSYFWWAIYYRPSIFKKVGIEEPINNWQELTSAAEKLRAAGLIPFSLGSRYRCPIGAWFDYLNMRINGPDFHQQLMDMKVAYTDERIKKVLVFFRELQDNHWFLGKPNTYDENSAVQALLNGEVGMTFIGSYVQDEYIPPEYMRDLDFFRFPIIDQHVAIGEDTPVDGFFASGGSKNRQDAGDFLLYLGSREVQALAAESITALPTRSDIDIGARKDLAKGQQIVNRADKLFQFFDLDTPWEIADVGMSEFNDYVGYETNASSVQRRTEEARLRVLEYST